MKLTLLKLILWGLVIGWGWGVEAAERASFVSTAQDREDIALTIYTSNLGLVKDTRKLDLPEGILQLQFKDVAGKIDPTTVSIRALGEANALTLLEQNYEYDLLSPQKLLEKYVGQRIYLATIHPETKKEEIVEATLLSIQGGNIFQIGDKISIGHPGRILLPKIPENLIPQPTLVWLLQNRMKKGKRMEVSYLTSGIQWKADYVALLNGADARLDLFGWVTIDNRSGGSYPNARLKLVAGDIHRAREEALADRAVPKLAAREAPSPQFKEEAFFDYHLYTLERRTTIRDNQTQQMPLLQASGIPVKKLFLFPGSSRFYYGRYDQRGPKQKVGVFLELENRRQNQLGIPLPRGIVRLYKEDAEGNLQFIGEDRIDHIPKDETFTVKMGEAFDIVGERLQTDYKHLAFNLFEVAFEVTLRNQKDEAIQVQVEEPVPGDWEILSHSHPFEKVQAHLIRFRVPIEKKQEVKVKYRIRFRY